MGPVSNVRPSVQMLGTSPQPSAGTHVGGTTAQTGTRAAVATAPETVKAVMPAFATGRAEVAADKRVAVDSYPVETAKARAEAAQRAYMMASLAAGLNPLADRAR